jgi:hypothetical protein
LIVRPWLVNKCINKLSKIRSEYFDARLNKIDGVDHALSLEILNNSERPEFLDHFSFSHIAFGFLIDWKPNRYQMEALEATRSSAPSWLQELHRQKNEALIAAVVINSPMWWPAIFFIWLGSLVFGKLRQFRDNFTVPMSRIPCPC